MSKRLIVPAYDPYPGPEWDVLFQHAADIAFVVLNVNSGPFGEDGDISVYKSMTRRLQAAGVKCLGYSSTRYGTRPIAEVHQEINLWFSRYAVDGIWLDEQASGVEHLAYYKRLRGSIGVAIMATNPGTVPDEAYYQVADIICDAETDQERYFEKMFNRTTGAKRCHIVFSVTNPAAVLERTTENAADYVYLATTVPVPGSQGPEFTIPDSIWPPAEATPAPAPPATVRLLSTCTDAQLVEEIARRLAR